MASELYIEIPDDFYMRHLMHKGMSAEEAYAEIARQRSEAPEGATFKIEARSLAEALNEGRQKHIKDWKRVAGELKEAGAAAFVQLFSEAARFAKIAAVGGDFDASEFPALTGLAVHTTGIIDVATPEGRQMLYDYIAERPADFSADLISIGAPVVGAAGKAVPALRMAGFAAKHPKLAKGTQVVATGTKVAMDPSELVGVGVDVGLGAAKKGVGAIEDAQKTDMSFEEGDLRYPTELDAAGNPIKTERAPAFVTSENPGTQKTAAALYKMSPGGFVRREYRKLNEGLRAAGRALMAKNARISDPGATFAAQIDELSRAFTEAAPLGDDARPRLEVLVGRKLSDAEFDGIVNGTADQAVLDTIMNDMLGNKVNEIGDPTSWQAGRNIGASFDKFKTDLNAELGAAYDEAMDGIKDKPAQYAKTIAYIDSYLDSVSQGRQQASGDVVALQELKAALEADNAGGNLTIEEMDKTRSEYRIKENPVLAPGRVSLSEARKRQVYRTMTDDLYDNINAVDPQKGAKLLATKTKDALYHRLLEKKFAETITKKAEKGEYAEIAKGLVTHKQFADPQMYADLKKSLGGEEGGGWLSLKSYYLQTLLESGQTRKSTDTAPRFSVTGLNNALRKNKEAYRQILGDEMADSLDAFSERLVGMEEFVGSIEGSQTAYNESMIQSLFGAAGEIGRSGRLPAVTASAAVAAQKIGEVVMGSFDGMWDWQATALAVGTGIVTLIGQDAYMAFKGKGMIAGIPAKMLPDLDVVNHVIDKARENWQDNHRTWVPRAARAASVARQESERRDWDPEMSSVLPGHMPPLN